MEYVTSSRLIQKGYRVDLISADSDNHYYLNCGYGKFGFSNTIYSYVLYRVVATAELDNVESIYPDNYSSKDFKLVNLKREKVILKILPGSFSAHQTNEISLYKNDHFVTSIPVTINLTEVDLANYLTIDALEPADIRFVIRDTFVPSSVWPSSQDHRELGLQIELSFY